MKMKKYEKNILDFVQDFDTFVNFILEKEPDLSTKNQVLGKNHCFELNELLNFKRKVEKATYIQSQYISIDFNFLLAVESNLFVIEVNKKNKFKLVKTSKLKEFIELNIYEKYVFLLECFWCKYGFEEKIRGYELIEFYGLIYRIGKVKTGTEVLDNILGYGSCFFSSCAVYSNILRILGLVELEFIDNVKNKYDKSIESIVPTELGIEICSVLTTEAIDYFDVDDDVIELIKERFKIKKHTETKSFFEIISGVFEEGIVEKTIDTKVELNRKGTYILKISLSKSIWRIVKLSHKETFHNLHNVIQEAFDFDNDHMYGFYKGASFRNGKEFYLGNPMGASEEYCELCIEEANIIKGQQFAYIFDFGDMWEFKIQVMDFIENEEFDVLPEIIEMKGESPDQYEYH
jgi:hypothetical protein